MLEAKNPFFERILKAEIGDFVITEQEETLSLLRVYERNPHFLILEEISFLKSAKPQDYAKWLREKAPGHLNWILYEIDLKSLKIKEAFSLSKQGWIKLSEGENFLQAFLSLSYKEISLQERKKIGPPPLTGEMDHRKVWAPSMIKEGEKVKDPSFLVYRIDWPKDTSPLSGKVLDLYFDQKSSFAFPFWIEAKGEHLSGFLRTIDSGKKLPSPHAFFPRRSPLFLQRKEKNLSKIIYLMQIPEYCLPFSLTLIGEKEPISLEKKFSLSLQNKEEETYLLEIFLKELPKGPFSLQIVPEKHPELAIQRELF